MERRASRGQALSSRSLTTRTRASRAPLVGTRLSIHWEPGASLVGHRRGALSASRATTRDCDLTVRRPATAASDCALGLLAFTLCCAVHDAVIQTRGFHNAYHLSKPFWHFPFIHALIPALWYDHPPLLEQLETGNRNFELDFHVNENGKVLGHHLAVIDDNTQCTCLSDCLQQLKDWSDVHPLHHGITIIMEPKCCSWVEDAYMADHHGPKIAASLEDVVVGVLGADKLLLPDDLRYRGQRVNPFPTLREAVRIRGWPSVDDMRGKFMFVLWKNSNDEDPSAIGTRYLADHPTLSKAILFTRVEGSNAPSRDDSAFVNWDRPTSITSQWFEPGKLGDNAKAAAGACPEDANGNCPLSQISAESSRTAALAGAMMRIRVDSEEAQLYGAGSVLDLEPMLIGYASGAQMVSQDNLAGLKWESESHPSPRCPFALFWTMTCNLWLLVQNTSAPTTRPFAATLSHQVVAALVAARHSSRRARSRCCATRTQTCRRQ